MITIVGLGPSNRKHTSVGAWEFLLAAPTVFVRTVRHPAVSELQAQGVKLRSFDNLYDESVSFEEVYAGIASRLLEEAARGADVVYAVPGHPLAGERAVGILITRARESGIEVRLVGSESFIEPVLEAVGVGFDVGLKILDALSLDEIHPDPDVPNLIYQVYDRLVASEVKLALMQHYPDEFEIVMVAGAGTDSLKVRTVPLYELDRRDFDHLSSVYVPARHAQR
jgi:tetrapyrrole methylase family protein/MazG family protein